MLVVIRTSSAFHSVSIRPGEYSHPSETVQHTQLQNPPVPCSLITARLMWSAGVSRAVHFINRSQPWKTGRWWTMNEKISRDHNGFVPSAGHYRTWFVLKVTVYFRRKDSANGCVYVFFHFIHMFLFCCRFLSDLYRINFHKKVFPWH